MWLDDTVKKLSTLSKLLRDSFDLEEYDNFDEAEQASKDKKFDVFLVDVFLNDQQGRTGVDFIEFLQEQKIDASIVILSAHLHQEQFRETVKTITAPTGMIEKSFRSENQVNQTIVEPIKHWTQNRPTKTPLQWFKEMSETGSGSPINMRFANFSQRAEFVQDQLAERAFELSHEACQSAFDDGAIWVLVCGSKRRLAHVAYSEDEILSLEEMEDIGRDRDRAFFGFHRNFVVDEISWSSSLSETAFQDYPTVSFRFSVDSESALTLHFDTGCPRTFISYELLVDSGLISPIKGGSYGARSETKEKFKYVEKTIDVLIQDQEVDERRKATSIELTAIKNWNSNSPFKGFCSDPGCDHNIVDFEGYTGCGFRQGLVGRNLLLDDGGVVLQLDGVNKKTKVLDR